MLQKSFLWLAASLLATPCFAQNAPKIWDPEEKWGKDIAKFDAADEKEAPPKGAYLFTGSSSVRLWDLPKFWPNRETINRGFGGSTIRDSIHFFDRTIAKHQPKVVLIYAGDNDVSKGLTADQVAADFEEFVALLEKKLPGTQLVYIAIKPSTKRWDQWPVMKAANDQIAASCEKKAHLHFADIGKPMLETENGEPNPDFFKDDGLHVNDDGYAAWHQVIEGILAGLD